MNDANHAFAKPMQLLISERALSASLAIVAFLHPYCLIEVDNSEAFLIYRARHFGSAAQRARLLARLKDPKSVAVVIKSADDLSALMGGVSVSQLLLEATGEIAPSTSTDGAKDGQLR